MRLSARALKNYGSINQFDSATEWAVRAGDPNTLYFQLIDLDQDGLRYLPTDASYGVVVTFPAVNAAGVVTKTATQASALDRSIWSVSILAADKLYGGNVQFAVTEATATRRFSVLDAISVEDINNGGC
jgi:hypothetical protein